MFDYLKKLWQKRSWEITGSHNFDAVRRPPSTTVRVTSDSVFGLPAFKRGVELISNKVANSKCHVFERLDDDDRRRAVDHPAYRLIHKQPNPYQSRFPFFRQLVTNTIWAGNGYAWIKRNGLGDPVGLYLLNSNNTFPVVVYDHSPEPEVWYQTEIDGKVSTFDSADIIHIRGIGNTDGFCGLSLVETMKESLGLGLSVTKFGAAYFRQGGLGQVVVELPTFINKEEEREKFRKSLEEFHQGIESSFRPFILPGGAKFTRNPLNAEEAQFIESRKMTLIDVANMMNLVVFKLNGEVNTGYGSIDAENTALKSDTYDPFLTNVEEEFALKLLTEEQKDKDTHYIEFDRSSLEIADKQTETSIAVQEVNNGLISWEEYRRKRNYTAKKAKNEEWRIPNGVTIQGEEPPAPPPQQTPPEPPQEEKPTDEPPPKDEARSKALLRSTVERLIVRICKNQPQNHDQLVTRHRSVFVEALPEAWVDKFFTKIGEELEAVLPEQRQQVLNSLDVESLTEELWNEEF